jgi:hypothetical protein
MKFQIVEPTVDVSGCFVVNNTFQVGGICVTASFDSLVDQTIYENVIQNAFDHYTLPNTAYKNWFVGRYSHEQFGYIELYALLSGGKVLYHVDDGIPLWDYLHNPDKLRELVTGSIPALTAVFSNENSPMGYIRCNELDALVCVMIVIIRGRYDVCQDTLDIVVKAVLTADRMDKIDALIQWQRNL